MTDNNSNALFEIFNSNSNRLLVLAPDKKYAIGIARIEGHIRADKNGLARILDLNELAASKPKFASSIRRAIKTGASGPVKDSDGCALVYTQVFMPLAVV